MARRRYRSRSRSKTKTKCRTAVHNLGTQLRRCAIIIESAQKRIPSSCYVGSRRRRTRYIDRRRPTREDDLVEGGFIPSGAVYKNLTSGGQGHNDELFISKPES